MKVILGIDGSLRSSGLVALNEQLELVDFCVISSNSDSYKDEELILYNGECYSQFIKSLCHKIKNDIFSEILYERASFGGLSGYKDKIAASYWYNRIMIKELIKSGLNIPWPIREISVVSWRSKVILKEDREQMKNENLTKQQKSKALKEIPVSKLPKDIFDQFTSYIKEQKLKKDSIFDLSDAYWITRHGFKRI